MIRHFIGLPQVGHVIYYVYGSGRSISGLD